MTEEEFIRNTNETMNMLNNHRIEENEQRRRPVKRTRKTKKIKVAVISALCGALLTAASVPNVQTIAGKNEITYKFATECMDGISDRDDSQAGHVMTLNGEEVSFETAIDNMVNQGKRNGFNDEEIYIALSKMYTQSTAEKALGHKIEREDLNQTARSYYLEEKAEEVRTHGR